MMASHFSRQRDWSLDTFGPGARTAGVLDDIRKELREIEAEPGSLEKWIDVAILAFDGAWRAGHIPQKNEEAWLGKQAKMDKAKTTITPKMLEAGAAAYCKWIGGLPQDDRPLSGQMIVWNEALAAAYRAMRSVEQREFNIAGRDG